MTDRSLDLEQGGTHPSGRRRKAREDALCQPLGQPGRKNTQGGIEESPGRGWVDAPLDDVRNHAPPSSVARQISQHAPRVPDVVTDVARQQNARAPLAHDLVVAPGAAGKATTQKWPGSRNAGEDRLQLFDDVPPTPLERDGRGDG